jgi:glycosyltransferase involved in cell wall biosynthesis
MLDTSGIGTYLRETLPRVVARMPDVDFTVLGDPATLRPLLGDDRRVDVRPWRTPIYTVREQIEARRLLPADATLVWSPHFNIPLGWRGPLVVTVHDVAHLALPQASLPRSLYARGMFEVVRRRASVLLCVSKFTEQEFRRRVGAPRRSVVSLEGVSARWFQLAPPAATGTPYFLYVGNVKPHKNLGRLIAAFARVASRIPHRLVIAGRRDAMRTIDHDVARLAATLGERVELTGYVAPAALEQLVAGCDALVLPSLYEGFGLPPLEALASGRPVVVSNAASLPEVCGPEAEYFDPLDVEDIAHALVRVATRPPDSDEIRGRRRAWARRFDWDDCACLIARELQAITVSGARHG